MPTETHSQTDPNVSTAAPFGILEGTHWIESLNDGTPVLVRPLREDDRAREEAFLRRLSPQSRRHRFLDTFKEASPALVDQLMRVDHQRQEAFIALAHDNGELREVGISRYSATAEDKQCECAVTVADDWQKRGLGVLLMRHLIDQARKNGYRQLISLDAADNESMHDLASYLGFRCHRDPQDATQVVHTLDL